MKLLFPLAIMALSAGLNVTMATAADYEPDENYIDIHFPFNQWAAVKTPVTPHIVICEGVIRYWPALEPRAVCEEKEKVPGTSIRKPARFIQLADWLEKNGYKPVSFVDIDDDHTLKLSIDKHDTRTFEGEEYEDWYGHKPGYSFTGVGVVDTGSIQPDN